MEYKIIIVALISLLLGLTIGFIAFNNSNQEQPINNNQSQSQQEIDCPDEWISNQMPRPVFENETRDYPTDYFIKDSQRIELDDFAKQVVKDVCNLTAQVVY